MSLERLNVQIFKLVEYCRTNDKMLDKPRVSNYEARDAVIAETAFGTDTHGLTHCQHVTP